MMVPGMWRGREKKPDDRRLVAVGSHGSEARDKFDETCILEKGGKLT